MYVYLHGGERGEDVEVKGEGEELTVAVLLFSNMNNMNVMDVFVDNMKNIDKITIMNSMINNGHCQECCVNNINNFG